jgi:putative flippase GtrA
VTPLLQRLYHLPLVGWVLRHRFPRFAVVGASGTVVNLVVLYLGQEFLFRTIEPEGTRLNFSLSLAVFVATINNFTWNRLWTWHDRREHIRTPVVLQFAQYGVACWLGILLQFVITKLLVGHVHYLVANVVAIVIASVANFVVNDNWTFGRLRLLLRRARHHVHAHDKPADPPRD